MKLLCVRRNGISAPESGPRDVYIMPADKIEPVVQQITALARTHIAGHAELYDPAQPFPFDIWAEMGRCGMLGLGLPREYGGGGGGGGVGYAGLVGRKSGVTPWVG